LIAVYVVRGWRPGWFFHPYVRHRQAASFRRGHFLEEMAAWPKANEEAESNER
jgi:hypothetical protein